MLVIEIVVLSGREKFIGKSRDKNVPCLDRSVGPKHVYMKFTGLHTSDVGTLVDAN